VMYVVRAGVSAVCGDGWCPARPWDEAERVSGRVSIDGLAIEFRCPESQDAGSGCGHVFDHDVQVELLGDSGIRPCGRPVVSSELEGEA